MIKGRNDIFAKGFAAVLPLLAMLVISSAVMAMEPEQDPGRIDLTRPDLLLTRIAWQDRTEFVTSRNRLNATYLGRLESQYGRHGAVSRSNLLNSPAARYFTRVLTGQRGK